MEGVTIYAMAEKAERDPKVEGLLSVRFGRVGTPDRDALEELARMGEEMKPIPANRNQMIRLAVREYVERHGKLKAKKK